jgi:hypothetical protein
MRVGGQLHAPAALPPVKRPTTHCIGGWWTPRPTGRVMNILPPLGFNPRTVQPVAIRYTDYAISAHCSWHSLSNSWFCLVSVGKYWDGSLAYAATTFSQLIISFLIRHRVSNVVEKTQLN